MDSSMGILSDTDQERSLNLLILHSGLRGDRFKHASTWLWILGR